MKEVYEFGSRKSTGAQGRTMLGHDYQNKKTLDPRRKGKRGRKGWNMIMTIGIRNTANISFRCLIQRLEKQL